MVSGADKPMIRKSSDSQSIPLYLENVKYFFSDLKCIILVYIISKVSNHLSLFPEESYRALSKISKEVILENITSICKTIC